MRALIISDTHSNLEALEAVLNIAPNYHQVWNLGDIVGYGASPNEVVERSRGLGGFAVRGNHDRACSHEADIGDFNSEGARAILWTREVLTNENRDWLAGLPPGPLTPNGSDVACVHGTPADEDEYLISSAHAVVALYDHSAKIILFGHTHRQKGFIKTDLDWYYPQPQFDSSTGLVSHGVTIHPGARYLLNPGSVGQPRDGDWRAAFAVYDTDRSLFTWYRTPYPVAESQVRIRNAGLPDRLADRLRTGI
jgi:predicted phosphodiesterase